MPTFNITAPSGKKYRITGETAEGALAALQQSGLETAAPEGEAMPDAPPGMKFDPVTGQMYDPELRQAAIDRHAENPVVGAAKRTGVIADNFVRGAADAATFGFADELAGAAGAATGVGGDFGQLNANIDAQRAKDAQGGKARLAGQVAGALTTAGGLAGRGLTLMRPGQGLGMTMLAGAGEGAAYGAAAGAGSAEGGVGDRAIGAGVGLGTGLLLGGAAPAVTAGVGAVARRGVDAVRNNIGSAAQQAQRRIVTAARAAGLDEAAINARLAELGPEGMLVDTLGTRGQALARSTANISPEAQATLEGASTGRMAGQNDRVVAELERASGLPAGSRSTVDDLKNAAYERVAPEIDEAYRMARADGVDIPLDEFTAIFQSPLGRIELRKAVNAARNFYAAGRGAPSRLGVLDLLKRGLDSRGRVAAAGQDDTLALQARDLARAVRERTDAALGAPTYARARALRAQAYRTDEAFDLGDELGRSRVALDGPRRAGAVAERDRQALAQGYAARKADELFNRRGTPGAIDALDTRMQREAMGAALGPNAAPVQRQLAAERQFGQTHRALTGNSTTARQLAQMGLTGAAGAGLGMYNGMDMTSAGALGIGAALARRGGAAAVGALRASNEAAVAPYMAQFLISNGLPATVRGAELAYRDPQLRRALARMLGLLGGGEAGALSTAQ